MRCSLNILVHDLDGTEEHGGSHNGKEGIQIDERNIHDDGLLLGHCLHGGHFPPVVEHHHREDNGDQVAEVNSKGAFSLGTNCSRASILIMERFLTAAPQPIKVV